MKRFLIQIAIFFGVVAIIDVCCGFGFDYLKSHAKGGNTYKYNYIAEKCEDDILILGSSRAARHYVPSVLEDSLGLSCYNAGEPGCGIIPAYARYKMVAERHKPKLVIYEVTPGYDYFVADDYSKYFGSLRQYQDKKPVKELSSAFGDYFDGIKAMSRMYRNNTCIVHNVMDQFSTSGNKGYEPLYGVLAEKAVEIQEVNPKSNKSNVHSIDSLKLSFVEKLIISTKQDNVPLLFIISPSFNKQSKEGYEQYLAALDLSHKYSIPFINCADMEGINGERQFFQDFSHMNNKGATKYTQELIEIIKSKCILQNI